MNRSVSTRRFSRVAQLAAGPAVRAAAFSMIVLAIMTPGTPAAAGKLAPGSGAPAPPLALRDLDGREVRLETFRGRAVVVNFWATWCAPCVAEMPSLGRMREKLAEAGVEVIGVNLQENAARIRPFAEKLGLAFPIVRDHDGAVSKRWGARVFPTTFVVGPDQRIALVAVGEIDWDAPEIEARVRAVLGRPGANARSRRAGTSFPLPYWSLPWTAAVS